MRSIQQRLPEFEALGIRPVAISVDAPAINAEQVRKAGYTFTFLSDPSADVIRRFDLVHENQGLAGADIARPAEFLVDHTGTVRWRNLTEDYRVRTRPEEVLAEARMLRPAR